MRAPRPHRPAAIVGFLCFVVVGAYGLTGCGTATGRNSAAAGGAQTRTGDGRSPATYRSPGRDASASASSDATGRTGSTGATAPTGTAGPAGGGRHFSGSRAYKDNTGADFLISAEISIGGATVDTASSDRGQATMLMSGSATVTIINTRPDHDLKLDVDDASIVGYWTTPQQRAFCTPGKYCHLGLLRQPLTGYLEQQGYPAHGAITMVPGSTVKLRFEGLPGRMELEDWVRRAAADLTAGTGPELLVLSLPSAVTNRGASWSCAASNAALTFDATGRQLDPADVMSRFGCAG